MSYEKEFETLQLLLKLNIEKIQDMSLGQLKALYDDIDTLTMRLTLVKQWLNVAVSRKLGKDFDNIEPVFANGYRIASIMRGIYSVKQVRKQNIRYDQNIMAKIANKITAAGDDPNLFMDIKYTIDERKYSSWQECQKAPFRDARHVTYSEPEYLISLMEVEECK